MSATAHTDYKYSKEILDYDDWYVLSVEDPVDDDVYLLMNHDSIENVPAIEPGKTVHFNTNEKGLVSEAVVEE